MDATCIYLVEDPSRYDVIVTDNLFGDIITDLAGAVAGGIGYAASANLNPDRTGLRCSSRSTGRPTTSPAPGRANPAAAIRSAALMLDHLGEAVAAAEVTTAVADFIASTPTRRSRPPRSATPSQKGSEPCP